MRFAKGRFGGGETEPWIIGLAGAGRGTGVTHLTLMLANYLCSAQGRKTAVLEWNDHGDFDRLGILCTGEEKEKDRYRILQADYYPRAEAGRLMRCLGEGYERVLIDFGVLDEMTETELTRCRAVWILISFSEWQMEAFWELMRSRESPGRESWQFFAAFGSEESRAEWNKRRRPKIERVPLSADAFTVTRELMGWMETALDRSPFSGDVSRKSLLRGKGQFLRSKEERKSNERV